MLSSDGSCTYRVCKNCYSDILLNTTAKIVHHVIKIQKGYWLLLGALVPFLEYMTHQMMSSQRVWCSVKLNFLFSFDIRHPIQDEIAETDQERLKPLQNNPPLPFVSRDRILLDH